MFHVFSFAYPPLNSYSATLPPPPSRTSSEFFQVPHPIYGESISFIFSSNFIFSIFLHIRSYFLHILRTSFIMPSFSSYFFIFLDISFIFLHILFIFLGFRKILSFSPSIQAYYLEKSRSLFLCMGSKIWKKSESSVDIEPVFIAETRTVIISKSQDLGGSLV